MSKSDAYRHHANATTSAQNKLSISSLSPLNRARIQEKVTSSSARATRSRTLQDTSTHVLAWCIVMIPLVYHSVAIWMEVVTPGVMLLLRLLSLLVIVMVPAVGISMLCDGMRGVPSSPTPVCRGMSTGWVRVEWWLVCRVAAWAGKAYHAKWRSRRVDRMEKRSTTHRRLNSRSARA